MTCCCSLRLLYKVHAIELDLQLQLHQVFLFSHYSLTELSKERLFLVEIPQPAFQGLAPWKCHPFYRAQQSNTRNVFGSLVTIITNLPPAHGHLGCLFLIFCIHFIAFTGTVTLYFHENFKVDDKLQDRKWLSAYNRVLCIYNSCWSSQFFAWEVWGLGL